MCKRHLCLAFVASLIVANASAAVINVDIGDVATTFSGQGAYADIGNNIWNGFHATGWEDITTGPLHSSDGSVTGVSMTVSAGGDWRYGNSNLMLRDYAFTSLGDRDSRTIAISGLDADAEYTLYLYGAGDVSDQGTAFTFGGNTAHTTGYLGSDYVLGANYVVMTATTNTSGDILGSWTNSTLTAPSNVYGVFNGIQIVPVPVPEPVTLLLLSLGGMLLVGRQSVKKRFPSGAAW